MSKGDIHTVKHGDGWANRAEGNEPVSNTAPTKAKAQAKGRERAIEVGLSTLCTTKMPRSVSGIPIRGRGILAGRRAKTTASGVAIVSLVIVAPRYNVPDEKKELW